MSQSSSYWAAIGLSAIGALGGILWAWFQLSSRKVPDPEPIDLVILVGAGLVLGIGAGLGTWNAQDVWVAHDNWWTALLAGFTAATTGALAGVAKTLFGGTRTPAVTPPAGATTV